MVETPPGARLDVWLDVACLYRTRSQAQTACNGGKVDVNGDRAKPHRVIRPGDEIRMTFQGGRRRIVIVREIEEHSVPKARARELYEDITPPPTPEEIEARRLLRMAQPLKRPRGAGAPKKQERRRLRQMKEEWD